MRPFIAKYAPRIIGVLSGFDRLVFRGNLRQIAFVDGLRRLLWKRQVLLKDFGRYAQEITSQLRDASLQAAQAQGRPIEYLPKRQLSAIGVQRSAHMEGLHKRLIAER